MLGGRRVAVNRPRVRSTEGHERKLPSWQEWSARDPLQQRAVEQMVKRKVLNARQLLFHRSDFLRQGEHTSPLPLILILLLLFGGGGGYYAYGPRGGIGMSGIVFIILVVLLLRGRS